MAALSRSLVNGLKLICGGLTVCGFWDKGVVRRGGE